jgi:23S rRNA (cytidine1920-2'-O)/16S rRNA (cytidine1409-2'-O)-methyltransferase
VLKVLPALCGVAAARAEAVVLIKPQFEVGPGGVSRGGVVRDSEARESAIDQVTEGFAACGWTRVGLTESPVRGAKGGNIEYLAHFQRVDVRDAFDLQ